MKATVLQPGARHAYMQSRFLHRAGYLQRLYTDFALPDHIGARLLARFSPSQSLRAKVARRTVAEIPGKKIRIAPTALRGKTMGETTDWPVERRDIESSDLFFTQYFAGGHGVHDAVAGRAKLVSDVFIVPSFMQIVNAECEKFPEWSEEPYGSTQTEKFTQFTTDMFEKCDALFCPSQSVIDDVASYSERYRDKCVLVPYGSSLSFPSGAAPEPRRILFAGTLTLRKGPQYVKQAADLLKGAGYSFIFAGSATESAARQLTGENIEILGHVSKKQMAKEYARADVFVLPSLAEGSAGVVLEAMSAGLPVVITRNAGVDFLDGDAGIYVPQCDGEALATALERICNDREMRDAMAAGAISRAAEYDHADWEEHFVGSLKNVV